MSDNATFVLIALIAVGGIVAAGVADAYQKANRPPVVCEAPK